MAVFKFSGIFWDGCERHFWNVNYINLVKLCTKETNTCNSSFLFFHCFYYLCSKVVNGYCICRMDTLVMAAIMYLFPALHSVTWARPLKISHGRSVNTMEIGKCCKSLLFVSESQLLNTYQHTIAQIAHWAGIRDLRNPCGLVIKYLIKQVNRVSLKALCKKKKKMGGRKVVLQMNLSSLMVTSYPSVQVLHLCWEMPGVFWKVYMTWPFSRSPGICTEILWWGIPINATRFFPLVSLGYL